MNTIACKMSKPENRVESFYFSKIDLKHACSQIPLHKYTQKHCNFIVLGLSATGTHLFVNGFYGLRDMLVTWQKRNELHCNKYRISRRFSR